MLKVEAMHSPNFSFIYFLATLQVMENKVACLQTEYHDVVTLAGNCAATSENMLSV